jgi:hypothetical protein
VRNALLAFAVAGFYTNLTGWPIEYRQIRRSWTQRLEKLHMPFRLVLRNGMSPPIPVVTVRIDRIVPNPKSKGRKPKGDSALHIGRVLKVEHWDRNKKHPK